MKTEPFQIYSSYIAIKAHFLTDYDYFKYNGKSRATYHAYEKSKYKYLIDRLSKRFTLEEFIDYCVFNFRQKKEWIGDFTDKNWSSSSSARETNYRKFQTDIQSLIIRSIKRIHDDHSEPNYIIEDVFENLFRCDRGNHPTIVKEYLGGRIDLDTMVILDHMIGYRKQFDKEIQETVVWGNVSKLISKYQPFMKIDTTKSKQITTDIINEFRLPT